MQEIRKAHLTAVVTGMTRLLEPEKKFPKPELLYPVFGYLPNGKIGITGFGVKSVEPIDNEPAQKWSTQQPRVKNS